MLGRRGFSGSEAAFCDESGKELRKHRSFAWPMCRSLTIKILLKRVENLQDVLATSDFPVSVAKMRARFLLKSTSSTDTVSKIAWKDSKRV